jgi:C_GCAxxG_C_C family probable redox protein
MEQEARRMFAKSHNCAQSVLGQFAERFGLERDLALRIATPFGGGIGHSDQLCGAVSGAIMAIGLAEGSAENEKSQREVCYAHVRELLAQFSAQHGSITCPGLLGLDLSDPDAYAQAHTLGLFQTCCPDYVGDAVRITVNLLGLNN